MATNFPSSLDSFTNPSASDKMDSVTVPHATQHANLNDAVEALEAKVGADGSAVTSSHDYILSNGVLPTLNVDSGVLVVDETNNRVGVNDSSPSYALDVTGDINATGDLRIGGTAVGTYTDYSASQTFGGFTLGNGTVTCSFARVNDLVHYTGQVALGSTSALSGPLDLNVPVTASYGFINNSGTGFFWQSGSPLYTATLTWLNGNVMRMQRFQVTATNAFTGDLSPTSPFTWAAGNAFTWNVVYRAA